MAFGRAGDEVVGAMKTATETITEVLGIGWKQEAELVELRAAAEKLRAAAEKSNQECLAARAEYDKLLNTEAFLKHALKKAREERAAATEKAEAATKKAEAAAAQADTAIEQLAVLNKRSKEYEKTMAKLNGTIAKLSRQKEAMGEKTAQLEKSLAEATDDAKTLRDMIDDAGKNGSTPASPQLVEAVRAALGALAEQEDYDRDRPVLAFVLDDTGGNPRSKKKDDPVRVVLLVHGTLGYMRVATKESRNGSWSATDKGSWRLYDPDGHLPADDDMDGGWSKETFVTRNKALDFLKVVKKRAWMNAAASYRFGILVGGQAGEEQQWTTVHNLLIQRALCGSREEMDRWLETAYDEFLPPAGAAGAAGEPEPEPETAVATAVATFSEPGPNDPVVVVVEDDRAAAPIRLPGGLKRPRSPEANPEANPEAKSEPKRAKAEIDVVDGLTFVSAATNQMAIETMAGITAAPAAASPEPAPGTAREVAGPHRDQSRGDSK